MIEPKQQYSMIRLELNPALGIPIYRQIMDGIREMIASGVLAPGSRLPSIRELAGELRINPSSAVKAYTELRNAGVIVLDHGRGTFVSERSDLVLSSRHELLWADLNALLGRAHSRGFEPEDVLRELRRLVQERKEEAS